MNTDKRNKPAPTARILIDGDHQECGIAFHELTDIVEIPPITNKQGNVVWVDAIMVSDIQAWCDQPENKLKVKLEND